MSDILEMVDPSSPVDYFWPPLEKELIPSPAMADLVAKYEAYGPFELFSAPIFGRRGKLEWPTKSRIEVAYVSGSRTGLIVWLSGFPDSSELGMPAQATAGLNDCDSPEHTLQRHQEKLRSDGKMPIVGLTECFDASGWHPVVLGY